MVVPTKELRQYWTHQLERDLGVAVIEFGPDDQDKESRFSIRARTFVAKYQAPFNALSVLLDQRLGAALDAEKAGPKGFQYSGFEANFEQRRLAKETKLAKFHRHVWHQYVEATAVLVKIRCGSSPPWPHVSRPLSP